MLALLDQGSEQVPAMMTRRPLRLRAVVLAVLLAIGAAPAAAQPIEAGSRDALELPDARQYAPPAGRHPGVAARHGQHRDSAGYGAVSPDLPATLPQQRGPGIQLPYGGYGLNGYGGPVDGDARSGYAGRDGYGSGDGHGGENVYGRGDGYNGAGGYTGGTGYGGVGNEFGAGEPAFVAPFGGGPGNQTPIPLGAGSLYSGSAVNGTAVGPQFSSQLPAYQGRPRR